MQVRLKCKGPGETRKSTFWGLLSAVAFFCFAFVLFHFAHEFSFVRLFCFGFLVVVVCFSYL